MNPPPSAVRYLASTSVQHRTASTNLSSAMSFRTKCLAKSLPVDTVDGKEFDPVKLSRAVRSARMSMRSTFASQCIFPRGFHQWDCHSYLKIIHSYLSSLKGCHSYATKLATSMLMFFLRRAILAASLFILALRWGREVSRRETDRSC